MPFDVISCIHQRNFEGRGGPAADLVGEFGTIPPSPDDVRIAKTKGGVPASAVPAVCSTGTEILQLDGWIDMVAFLRRPVVVEFAPASVEHICSHSFAVVD